MDTLSGIGRFIQEQILGMQWLSNLVAGTLELTGIDVATKLGSTIHFFIYDVIKILILLVVLIFFISYLQSYFSPERTKKILGRYRGISANILGALLGTLTPFCSCSSIPIFIGFIRAGLPLGVTFSFLISSPMVDLGSLVILMSIFGWKVALAYVILGLLIAIVGGILIDKLKLNNQIEPFVTKGDNVDISEEELNFSARVCFAVDQVSFTLRKVFLYVIFGVGIGAFIHNWIPQQFIESILGGNNPVGVVLATVAGIPMYADIFGTIPIAEALLDKGAKLGVVLSFMMAVTTLSLPEIVMLKNVVKPKLLAIFVLICTCGIIIVGYTFNLIQDVLVL